MNRSGFSSRSFFRSCSGVSLLCLLKSLANLVMVDGDTAYVAWKEGENEKGLELGIILLRFGYFPESPVGGY